MPTRSVTINGLKAQTGDVCLCITGGADHRRLERAVLDGCDEVDADPGLLQMEDAEDTYLSGGTFSADRMLTYWGDWGQRTFAEEGRGFARAATDMSWAQNVITGPLVDDFMGYEVQATRYARSYPQVALCLYDLDKFRGNVIIPVLKVHPKVFFAGMLLENPYYVDPDELEA